MHPLLRHGSTFWLAAQMTLFIALAVGAAALCVMFEALAIGTPGAVSHEWAATVSVGFVVIGSMLGVVVFISRTPGLHRPVRLTARYRRRRMGLCPHCGFDVRWRFESGCPECGWKRRGSVGAPHSH